MNQQFSNEYFSKNQFIWHYYDNNGVHIGIHLKNYMSDNTPMKSNPAPFHELGGEKGIKVITMEEVVSFENKLFILKDQKLYPLMPNLPSPNYNDDFGFKKMDIHPNIIERAKLNSYADLYAKFLSHEGLSKEELETAIKLKQSLINSRRKKIEDIISQKEYEEFVKSISIGAKFKQWRNSVKQKKENNQSNNENEVE